jgi:menaquinone-dependent protoporphyrinogen oxidase
MKVLVTAASKHGATAGISEAIAETLQKHGLEVTVSPAEEVKSIEGYEAVVVGSGVYAGQWLKPAKELIEHQAAVFADLPVRLFSSGPIGDPPKPEEDTVEIADIVDATQPRDHRIFAGRLIKSELGFAERAMVAAVRSPEGDFRDWDEIAAWATSIAHELMT